MKYIYITLYGKYVLLEVFNSKHGQTSRYYSGNLLIRHGGDEVIDLITPDKLVITSVHSHDNM